MSEKIPLVMCDPKCPYFMVRKRRDQDELWVIDIGCELMRMIGRDYWRLYLEFEDSSQVGDDENEKVTVQQMDDVECLFPVYRAR